MYISSQRSLSCFLWESGMKSWRNMNFRYFEDSLHVPFGFLSMPGLIFLNSHLWWHVNIQNNYDLPGHVFAVDWCSHESKKTRSCRQRRCFENAKNYLFSISLCKINERNLPCWCLCNNFWNKPSDLQIDWDH